MSLLGAKVTQIMQLFAYSRGRPKPYIRRIFSTESSVRPLRRSSRYSLMLALGIKISGVSCDPLKRLIESNPDLIGERRDEADVGYFST